MHQASHLKGCKWSLNNRARENDSKPGVITRGWEANGISYSVPRQSLQTLQVGRLWRWEEALWPPPFRGGGSPDLRPRAGLAGGSKSFPAAAQAVDSRHPGSVPVPPAGQPSAFPPAQSPGGDPGRVEPAPQTPVWLWSPSPRVPPSLSPEVPDSETWSRPGTGAGRPDSRRWGLRCDGPAWAHCPPPYPTQEARGVQMAPWKMGAEVLLLEPTINLDLEPRPWCHSGSRSFVRSFIHAFIQQVFTECLRRLENKTTPHPSWSRHPRPATTNIWWSHEWGHIGNFQFPVATF